MVVKTDIPYTGLAAFVGKPADGVSVSFQGFLNNRVPFEGLGAFSDSLSTLAYLNPEAEAPEESPLLPLVAGILETVVATNQQHHLASRHGELQGGEPQLTVFHGQRAPPISIQDYLVRIAKYTKCSPAAFIHALAHMMRLAEKHESLCLTPLNVHRLVLTGVMLSAKFLDDRYFNNAFYAKVGGVSTVELNRLEVEMLTLLDFRLLVTPEDVHQLLFLAQTGQLAGLILAAGGVHLSVGAEGVSSVGGCGAAAHAAALGLPGVVDVAANMVLGVVAGAAGVGGVPGLIPGAGWGETAAVPTVVGVGAAAAQAQQQHHELCCQQQAHASASAANQHLQAAVAAAAGGVGVAPQPQQRKRRSGSLEQHEADCKPRMMYHRRSLEIGYVQ